ncbi:MAG TPA: phosphate ABC transporter permease subunit PstC [Bryobacteraceae bacterium]|nr:phosphate ABC transporter permease subunit PstC [Bryobacteraceae bacterium]
MATQTAVVVKPVRKTSSQMGDQIARLTALFFACVLIAIVVLLVYELFSRSAAARAKFGWHFLASSEWNPVTEEFGALPFLYGTVITSLVAMVLSIPLGMGAAIFLAELAPVKLSNSLTFVIELLAAIPSVIYGLLAIFTLVPLMREYVEPALKAVLGFLPFFQGPVMGVGYLTAGLVLAIMTVPFIISVSREALLAVPREQREAALALGATRWETTWQIVVPYAKLGILGSIFLGLARALGETMAVTMVVGNLPAVHAGLFWPGSSIAAAIANEFSEAGGTVYPAALIELGLVLFGLTIVINGFARLMIVATTKKGSKR